MARGHSTQSSIGRSAGLDDGTRRGHLVDSDRLSAWTDVDPAEDLGGLERGIGAGEAVRAHRDGRDDVMEEALLAMLADELDVMDVELTVHAGEVTLEGTVMSADDRRLAAELVAQKPGVRAVRNRLRVRRDA